jgi:dTDP-4-amino-4,6-dideoxygalactose transaminase
VTWIADWQGTRGWIQTKRHKIWDYYRQTLEQWALAQSVRLPFVPQHCEHAAHMFYLIMPSPSERDRFIRYLKAKGILAVFHYTPLHISDMGLQLGSHKGDCPVCEDVSARLVRLPFSNKLGPPELDRIASVIRDFRVQ